MHSDVNREAEFLLELLENAIYCDSPSNPSITITKDQKEKTRRLLETIPDFERYLTYLDGIVGENSSVDSKNRYVYALLGRLEEAVYGRSSYNSEDSSD